MRPVVHNFNLWFGLVEERFSRMVESCIARSQFFRTQRKFITSNFNSVISSIA
jgi:hypothetical protein